MLLQIQLFDWGAWMDFSVTGTFACSYLYYLQQIASSAESLPFCLLPK